MDSPIHFGDLTTNSIQHRLSEAYLNPVYESSLSSAVYNGVKVIQLTVKLAGLGEDAAASELDDDDVVVVLRRVQDSYINITQLLSILSKLNILSQTQTNNYLTNKILLNSDFGQGTPSKRTPQILDYQKHENAFLRGVWVPYEMAVRAALKFDLYELTKELLLVDVHDYENLPKSKKRNLSTEDRILEDDATSPIKKQRLSDLTAAEIKGTGTGTGTDTGTGTGTKDILKDTDPDRLVAMNPHFPHTLPPVVLNENQLKLRNAAKGLYGRIFKKDEEQSSVSEEEIKNEVSPILQDHQLSELEDIPLDQKGQTALHFASTLASSPLVSAFITLGLTSPIRGDNWGESPLISCIKVTNAMENGNFAELLRCWLHPNIWLVDNRNRTVLHHLAMQIGISESYKHYVSIIVEYILSRDDRIFGKFKESILDAKDDDGLTALHIAVEKEDKWFIKLLMEMGANARISNKHNVKCEDFEILNEVSELRFGDRIFDVIGTNREFLAEKVAINGGELPSVVNSKALEIDLPRPGVEAIEASSDTASHKIFESIHKLLSDTGSAYAGILNSKQEQIKLLDQALHDATIVTVNNRFQSRKLTENLVTLDNLKLQAANVSDKLTISKQEIADDELQFEENQQYDADEPFLIKSLYQRVTNGESIDDLKGDEALVKQLQPVNILKARINAYKRMNESLENELQNLIDYKDLTSKFKNVVSTCTNVGVNDVDELLDGLLEAVEVQQ
ncbi:uncharacterized protein LODBEIA_P05330 [Lodderomyces beijingensis]|uniref:HTH APSES-type domain-containing protein n=1 Tax=Lodderomyces beijingensis TaxID=1775926 RepID=A0ABP0ZDQ7_9ASCO